MPIVPLAPITPTHVICLGCGQFMRLHIEKYNNGKVSGIVFYCDKCQYGHKPSMIHAPGETVKYVPPPPTPLPAPSEPADVRISPPMSALEKKEAEEKERPEEKPQQATRYGR